jgi:hypothetical protein
MRKVLPFLGASLSVLAISLTAPSKAQDAKLFQDVPQSHWAYESVSDLQTKGILLGYPDGYFRGKRPLTRYEFAVALERMLKNLPPGPVGPAGSAGVAGPAGADGAQGPPGVTPEELAAFRRLADEFRNELTQIGANVRDINSRLDALSRDVADLRDQFNRMVKFGGDFFVGVRSDRSRVPFFDYSGAVRSPNPDHFSNVDAVHDFHLTAKANLPGGVKFTGDLVASNYLGYRTTFTNPFTGGVAAALGNVSAASPATSTLPEEVTLYQAQLDVPIGGFGSNTVLTVGRYKNQVTPLTYYRPDTDAYFDIPWYDDGNYVEDGFKLESKFGSAKTSIFAGSYRTLTTTNGALINAPLVGANYNGNIFSPKPTSLSLAGDQVTAGQSAGLHIGIPLFRFGELGFTAIDFGSQQGLPVQGNFNNVMVYGVNLKLNQIGRFTVQGEAAKSVTQIGFASSGDNNINDDNNAFLANVGYNSGPVNAVIGYQYIDPRFAAPGYWNKIGNWYNPTNISGPYARVTYNFSNALVGYVGGDYYSGARNRPFPGGFTPGSNVARATAGIKYNINKLVNVSAAYEGVLYDLSPSVSVSGNRAKPVEQYITFGAGLNLASNTVLKIAYQILNQQDVGGGFGDVTAIGGGNVGANANASVFTTQLAVHF